MFPSIQRRRPLAAPLAGVDVAPLIDIVFILLIFFLVTTTFDRESGIAVERPRATHASALAPMSLRVQITSGGEIYCQGERMEPAALTQAIRRALAERPALSVVVVPDAAATAGRLVEVLDAAKGAGVRDVAVAALQQGTR